MDLRVRSTISDVSMGDNKKDKLLVGISTLTLGTLLNFTLLSSSTLASIRCECPIYVQNKLFGGAIIPSTDLAKNAIYGLPSLGYSQISMPQSGAIVVMQPGFGGPGFVNSSAGHIGIVDLVLDSSGRFDLRSSNFGDSSTSFFDEAGCNNVSIYKINIPTIGNPNISFWVNFDVQGTVKKVQDIYKEILGRSGDTVAIERDVIPLIRSGSKTLDDVRREVASSDEAWNIARQTYLDVLGRTGDEIALRSEVTKVLASGTSQATLRRNIAKTREVLDKVMQIYIDVLGRGNIEESSLWNYDLELLANGTVKSLDDLRKQIVANGEVEVISTIQKIYKDILGREGNPNDIKQYTLADLASGKTTILKIRQATADSPEAKNPINMAFQSQNGRLPFPSEMEQFTDALVSGATISDVLADIQGIKQLKGFSALSPLLPQFVQDGWKIFTDIASGLWVDPPTKKGFQYEALGESVFKGISDFPDGIDADDTFSVFAENQFIGRYQPGQSIDFVSIFGKGVKSFSVTDIESKDPNKDVVNFSLPILFGEDHGSLRMREQDSRDNWENSDKPPEVPEPIAPIVTIAGFAMILKRLTKKSSS